MTLLRRFTPRNDKSFVFRLSNWGCKNKSFIPFGKIFISQGGDKMQIPVHHHQGVILAGHWQQTCHESDYNKTASQETGVHSQEDHPAGKNTKTALQYDL